VRDRSMAWLALAALAVIAVGFFLPGWLLNQMVFAFGRGLAVLGLVVLWRAGLVSLGGALYFGLGAYSVALLQKEAGVGDALLLIVCAACISGFTGFVLGFLLRRYRGIFFAMMNLAFSMILYGAAVKNRALGSTDGFGIAVPSFLGTVLPNPAQAKLALFVLLVIVSYAAMHFVHSYWKSTLGWMATGIRDNEIRVEYLGYSVERAIHIKYTISAVLGGLGGAFLSMGLGQVDPDSMLNWVASGELLFVMILSGPSSVAAPFVASIFFELLRTYALEIAPLAWQFIIGATLVLLIFFAPNGVLTIFERVLHPRRRPGQ
jgi:ABC-type branched-subunit amino acid transport system permease subunit